MSRAAAAIEALRRRHPDAVLLARAVSFAAVIDRGLLRAARLELLPGADAGSEADLWFSSVVTSRTSDGIVLDPEAAEELRGSMTPEEREEAWRLTSDQHQPWLAPSLLFEEEIAYLSSSKDPGARGRLVERVQSVVRAMLQDDRPGLAQWASRALRMFPTAVRELPEAMMLDAGTRIRLGQGPQGGEETALPEWLPLLAPSEMPRTKVQVELRERELVLAAPAGGSLPAGAQTIDVPETVPLVLEVSWQEESAAPVRQVTLRAGETARLPVGNDSLRIRTITGEEYEINESPATSPSLQSAVIDFAAEMARHTLVIGRESELAELMARSGLVLIAGERGIGKTALLCELTRRLAPAPVFVHFFRSGDYWMGSIAYAMRSLAAQIALRNHLDDSVLDLSLGDVLARLALSPRCPPRLYIVLDDIDDARDQDRNVPDEPLAAMFSALPGYVTVYASSVTGLVNAEMRRLVEETHRIEEILNKSRAPVKFEDRIGLGAEELGDYLAQEDGNRLALQGLLEDARVFRLQGNVDATIQLFGSSASLRQGNFAKAAAMTALARAMQSGLTSGGAGLHALSLARWPLPAVLFEDFSASPLVQRDGELVEVLPGYSYENTVLSLGLQRASGELLARLERHRDREDVRRYYALHAPEHLIAAGRLEDARDLCLDLTFMREVVRYYEPALMRAHVLRVFEGPDEDLDTWRRREVLAFEREADAMVAAPDEIDAILRTYSPDDLLEHPSRTRDRPPYRSRLVLSAPPPEFKEIPVRRHVGAVGGIIGIGGDQPVTWGSDGRLLFWPSDPSQPPLVRENATPITAAAQSGLHVVYGDAAGVLYYVGPDGKVADGAIQAHASAVSGVIAAVDGNLFASWSSDGVIRLWWPSADGIRIGGELGFHEDEITACAFVGDKRLLVSSSRDGTIRTWSISEKRAIQVIRQEAAITGLVISSDGRWLAAADDAGKLRIAPVEPATEGMVTPYLLDAQHAIIEGIVRSSDDRYLVTWGGEGGAVWLWQMPPSTVSGTSKMSWGLVESPQKERVAACAFLDPHVLFVSWTNGDAWLVNVGSPPERRELKTGGSVIRSVLARPQPFFAGDDRGRLIEWSKRGGQQTRDWSKAPEQIDAIAVAGENVLTVSAGGKVAFAGSTVSEHIAAPRLTARGNRAAVWSATYDHLLLADLADIRFRRFENDNARNVVTCALGQTLGLFAVASDNGEIFVVNESSSVPLRIPALNVRTISFASNDSILLAAHGSGQINTFDVASGKVLSSSTGDATEIVSIEVDEPRRRFATVGADRKIRIRSLDGDTPPILLSWEVDPALGCRFAPNGELVAIGWNEGVRILSGPDARAASGASTISTGPKHRGRITGFDVGYDVVFTCSEDRTVRMWNLQTGDQEAVVYGFNAFRSISAAGDEIVAGDDAGEVWRFIRNFGNGVKWFIVSEPADSEFVAMLTANLEQSGIERSLEASDCILEVAGASQSGFDAQPRQWFSGPVRGIITVVLDETIPFESIGTTSPSNRVDFRRWRDPYEFAARFRELLRRMDGATASPQASAE